MKSINFFLFTIFATMFLVTAHAQNLTNGLISYYPFNGNANDLAGTNTGTVQGATLTTDQFTNQNSAYLFNGSNSAITLPAKTFNSLNSGTISTWLFLNRTTQEVIFAKQHDGVNSYGIFTVGFTYPPGSSGDPGRLYFQSQNSVQASSTTLLTTGVWYNVAVTFSSTNCIFYINGSRSGLTLGNFSIPNDPSPTTTSIGSWEEDLASSLYATLAGKIDDFRIYNRALSSNEMAQLYVSGPIVPLPHAATGIPVLFNGFVVGVTITDGGYGYTNIPSIRFFGSGGSGAQATAVVSNGVVTAVNINNAGNSYPTNATVVVFDPPFIPQPGLSISPLSFLTFSNLTLGRAYQLQKPVLWYWTNQFSVFTSTATLYTQVIAGVAGTGSYRLATNPPPGQAFATPQVVNGFVVGASISSGGSGYVTNPAVNIVGGGGNNATATSKISGSGVVTNVSIVNPGSGYTNSPTIQIAPPPTAALFPAVLPGIQIDSANLVPYDNYQFQFKPVIISAWANSGALFSPTNSSYSQSILITNGTGFFRLQQVP